MFMFAFLLSILRAFFGAPGTSQNGRLVLFMAV